MVVVCERFHGYREGGRNWLDPSRITRQNASPHAALLFAEEPAVSPLLPDKVDRKITKGAKGNRLVL